MSDAAQTTIPDAQSPDLKGWVRRADVSLRAAYPNLVTRIFEVAPLSFAIVFDRSLQEASTIDFANKIRPVTLRAEISNEIPQHYLREIEPIRDSELALHYEGFPFTQNQLFNLIVSRFPHLALAEIGETGNPITITIELTTAIGVGEEKALMEFCSGIGVPASFQTVVTGRTIQQAQEARKGKVHVSNRFQPDFLTVGASRLRPAMPDHLRVDEEYWFNHLDAICAGQISVEDMPGIYEGDARCFVDATIGEHINFRQLLAYYDTIYLSPPLKQGHHAFLQHQALSQTDLLDLITSGRLKILLTQAEERLDIRFLTAAAERSPTSLIGRRTAAAMLIADVVHTANRYRLNDQSHYAELGLFSRAIADQSGIPADQVLQFILWPVTARRGAILALLERGTKGILNIGLGPFIATLIKTASGKDLDFEALTMSEKVHIAHAIGATCFPMREEGSGFHLLANLMGDALNFFRSFNFQSAESWRQNAERQRQGKVLLPPLSILEFDAEVPIREVLDATESQVMRNRGRALFSRLADMTDEQRDEEIRELSALLRRFGKPSGIMSLDNVDTGIAAVATLAGLSYPPLAGLFHIGAQGLAFAKRYPAVDRFLETVAADLFRGDPRKRELDFLSRINRVATLKATKVS